MAKKTPKEVINDIFNKKPKKDIQKNTVNTQKNVGKKANKKGSKKKAVKADTGGNSERRYTSDGIPIYTYEELNIGKGGGTDACPFDCNCCF